jgi:hypothetical protein
MSRHLFLQRSFAYPQLLFQSLQVHLMDGQHPVDLADAADEPVSPAVCLLVFHKSDDGHQAALEMDQVGERQ